MILKGSQRSGAVALADHLMNEFDNDHLSVIELRGFVSDTLHGALSEAYAISKATCCKQFMFSLSLNPPQDYIASDDDFLDAAERAEKALGLGNQPRAIVVHEKEGRRHAHVVWSRIDVDEMKAINLPHFKNKLRDLARELFLDHGWALPDGLASYGNKSPLNFTLEEWQIAKRKGIDPREIKQTFQQAWQRSDSLIGLKNALEEQGFFLAKGDRRGFVALDVDGKVYALAKWCGVKAKDIKAKHGVPTDLSTVEQAKQTIRSKMTTQMRDFISQVKERHDAELDPIRTEHAKMKELHREERRRMTEGQERRWAEETRTRSERLNKGLRGLFDRMTGKAKAVRTQNEMEARQSAQRDQDQREMMINAQMHERQTLQQALNKAKTKHMADRRLLAQSVRQSLRAIEAGSAPSRTRYRGLDLSL